MRGGKLERGLEVGTARSCIASRRKKWEPSEAASELRWGLLSLRLTLLLNQSRLDCVWYPLFKTTVVPKMPPTVIIRC